MDPEGSPLPFQACFKRAKSFGRLYMLTWSCGFGCIYYEYALNLYFQSGTEREMHLLENQVSTSWSNVVPALGRYTMAFSTLDRFSPNSPDIDMSETLLCVHAQG